MPRIYSGRQIGAHFAEAAGENAPEWGLLQQLSQQIDGISEDPEIAALQTLGGYLHQMQNEIEDFNKAKDKESKNTVFNNLAQASYRAYNYINTIKDKYPETYRKIAETADQLLEQEMTRGQKTLASLGEQKSATKWIEQFQKEAKKGQPVNMETVAKIIAARQLANAVRGKSGNIDAKMLSEEEINAKAAQVMRSELFKEFFEQKGVTVSSVKAGHGGKMEMDYDAFIKSREDVQDLDEELYGRYKYQFGCDSYTEFMKKYAWNEKKFKGASEDERIVQAARMVVAAEMTRTQSEKRFNEVNLNKKALKLAEEPLFRLAVRKPGVLQQMTAGDTSEFNISAGEVQEDFDIEQNEPGKDQVRRLEALSQQMGGHTSVTEAEKQEREARIKPKLDPLNEQIREVTNDPFIVNMSAADKLLMKAVATDKELKKLSGGKSTVYADLKKNRNEALAKVNAPFEARKNEINTNLVYSPAYKKQLLKQIEQERQAEIRRGRELRRQWDIRMKRLDALDAKRFALMEKAGLVDREGDLSYAKNEKAYLSARGPKYRKMFHAVQNYYDKAEFGELESKDVMDAVASILEYQDGKEKAGGSQRERVDRSMRALAMIVKGTPNEKILDSQIQKINAARGLQPGQKGALSKEILTGGLEAEQKLIQQERNIYDKIHNFTFARNEEEKAELDKEFNDVKVEYVDGNENEEDQPEKEEKKEEYSSLYKPDEGDDMEIYFI